MFDHLCPHYHNISLHSGPSKSSHRLSDSAGNTVGFGSADVTPASESLLKNPKKFNHRRKKTVTLLSKAPKHQIGIIHDHTTETFMRNRHDDEDDEFDHSEDELHFFLDDDI